MVPSRSILLFLSLVLIMSLYTVFAESQQVPVFRLRYYVGYTFGRGYYGISGKIFTINPSVQDINYIAQWIGITTSYSRGYWIQVGYNKGFDTNYKLKFYVEKKDKNGHSIIWVSSATPSAGTTYTYIIIGGTFDNGNGWKVIIRHGVNEIYSTIVHTDPYTSEDLQAFSETTSDTICIDGTHFSSLSYYTGRSFPLWDQHEAHVDEPYRIQEVSDYEFIAWGGGS